MKQIRYFNLLTLIVLLINSSCKKDDVSRNDFTGRYDLTENSITQGSSRTYEINIRRSSQGNDQVIIENFYGAGITVNATLSNTRITIAEQESGNFILQGIGALNGSELTLTFDVETKGTSIIDYCTATGTRK
ncbi:hypothetical protein GXP67_36375 [Rhodocytophaga rosea]|uniref:Lipocalin-like domain-containing protein n=1 Tax=Rhodocytophaga rosea TaxID=2704465 RepID=A0A6C0GVA9_9BACT|nr:hypothetical protein [Rhodocytophaga rosea]QHT71754.1 hypothetical protein GXP67_36375 [Rhodocytophaga rosea]